MFKRNTKGFTLVELLVVIAIIGILASIVLVSLNSARERSRDARRVADINQMRTALETFHLDDTAYPAALSELSPEYMTTVPNDPQGNAYLYGQCAGGSGFALGIAVENTNDPVLNNDTDGTVCGIDCGTGGAGTDTVYCVSQE